MNKRLEGACQSNAGAGNDTTSGQSASSLLSLPLELVLGLLKADDLRKLLQTSKDLAKEVMQHCSGRLELQMTVRWGRNWAPTRQLLQWAPPACMRVKATQPYAYMASQQREAQGLSNQALEGLFSTHAASDTQQLQSLIEVRLEGMILPWLVPPGLPDTCPNVHTLELSCCRVSISDITSSSSSSINTSRKKVCSKTDCVSQAPPAIAASIENLKLFHMSLPELGLAIPATCRSIQQRQQLLHQRQLLTEQVRASLPNLRCLCMDGVYSSDTQFLILWGAQLQEAQLTLCQQLMTAAQGLSQVTKLALPSFQVCNGSDLGILLALPHLTHVELEGFHSVQEDLSNYPCRWQYLKLHLTHTDLQLGELTYVPLHSLTMPLVLGHNGAQFLAVALPVSTHTRPASKQTHWLSRLQHLSNQLMLCSVQLLAPGVDYQARYYGLPVHDDSQADAFASALITMSPVFGPAQCVAVHHLCEKVFQALNTAHQGLRHLHIHPQNNEICSGSVWVMLLSEFPLLERLYLCGTEEATGILRKAERWYRSLVLAMAKQPEGRQLEVWVPCDVSEVYESQLRGTVCYIRQEGAAGCGLFIDSRLLAPSVRVNVRCMHKSLLLTCTHAPSG